MEQMRALFQEEMAKVHDRLDALEGDVAQLRDRLSPASDKASAPKRGTRTKPPADAVVDDVELPAQD